MSSVLPYGRQNITQQDIEAVVEVLKGDFLTQGPAIELFEKSLGAYLESRHTIAVSNGTAGLHIAYLAAGVGPKDAVIVPAITFAATANAALYCGAIPVFADIDPVTGCMDPESVERCIKLAQDNGLNPKVIAPVHYAGLPAKIGQIQELANHFKITVVEDSCHALGAEWRSSEKESWSKVGSGLSSSMAVFSFHPVKHITTGEGGAVTTDDPELARKLRLLRSHGITKNPAEFVNSRLGFEEDMPNPWYHEMQILGFNYRMCDIQAALGASQLGSVVANISRRREIAKSYHAGFSNLNFSKSGPGDNELSKHSYHLFPLRIDFSKFKFSRASLMSSLREMGIGTQVHYLPVNWHPFYVQNNDKWLSDETPHAEAFYSSQLSIPMYSTLTDSDVNKVIDCIRNLKL